MIYIGFISKSKNIELVKELNKLNVRAINIKKKEDIENKRIDILVIEDYCIDKVIIEEIINEVKYLIIQDNINNLQIELNKDINIITFGFNHKSSVTISSVTDENIVIFIQSIINSIKNNKIEFKEISIKNTNKYNINKHIIKKIIQEILENREKI